MEFEPVNPTDIVMYVRQVHRLDIERSSHRGHQQPSAHEKGNLLDNGERVGDAAGSEFSPELVDFVAEFSSNHWAAISS